MTGRLSKCGKKPSRAPGPPSLSPHRSPLHPLQPAPGGCCPHPWLSWGPRVPEGPGHAHVAALAPKEPGCAQPPASATSCLPHSVSRAAAGPTQDQGRPGRDFKAQSRKGRFGPKASKAPSCWIRSPNPWAAGWGQALCPLEGAGRGSCCSVGRRSREGVLPVLARVGPGLGGGAEVSRGQSTGSLVGWAPMAAPSSSLGTVSPGPGPPLWLPAPAPTTLKLHACPPIRPSVCPLLTSVSTLCHLGWPGAGLQASREECDGHTGSGLQSLGPAWPWPFRL